MVGAAFLPPFNKKARKDLMQKYRDEIALHNTDVKNNGNDARQTLIALLDNSSETYVSIKKYVEDYIKISEESITAISNRQELYLWGIEPLLNGIVVMRMFLIILAHHRENV